MVNTIMEHKGFKAQVMEAQRLTGDYVHELPPGNALPVYPVDMLLNPPENWMKGPGVFVIPVKPDRGLWFNWTANSDNNTAVIPTVKGCNPITGMPTSGFHMERYENKCPKHGCDFLHDRFCPECGYKWPAQNYVGPKNMLWWDGFLNQKDGTVRQFFFSEEELRDVASALIGKENTVPAFGFAFYAPKERRAEPHGFMHNGQVLLYQDFKNTPGWDMKLSGSSSGYFGTNVNHVYYSNNTSLGSDMVCDSYVPPSEVKTSGGLLGAGLDYEHAPKFTASNSTPTSSAPLGAVSAGTLKKSRGFSKSVSTAGKITLDSFKGEDTGMRGMRAELKCTYDQQPTVTREVKVKEVSIGAGAKINQKLNPDPYELNTWKEVPDSVMTIYFVFQEKFEELKSKGIRDLEGSKEGMLSGCVVG